MIGYIDALNTMHTRGVSIDERDYIYTLMIVLGEEPQNAYAMAYDQANMRKNVGTEQEEVYLSSLKKEAENLMEQQHIIKLRDLLSDAYRAHVQQSALSLKEYKFSGQETVQILNNLLKSKIEDLESSSVKDVVGIIKMLTEQGALEVGDSGFSKHFIIVKDAYPALCVHCNREFDIYPGVGAKCPHCGQPYQWSIEENRFYPQPAKL